MGIRRKGREFALQALYLSDVVKWPMEKAYKAVTGETKVDKLALNFSYALAMGTSQHLEAIDALIVKVAQNWEINRMAALDRNLLRLGAYELLYELDTPVSVIIDEAVEIAKEYSTPESGKFVNGILDKIKQERPTATTPKK